MPYIKLFKAADNTEVSPAGQFTNSIDFTLRADLEQEGAVRLYVQADNGFSVSDTIVGPVGASASKWALALDNAGASGAYGAWGAALSLAVVGAGAGGRKFFWAKARATADETPVNDTSVTLNVEGIAAAV